MKNFLVFIAILVSNSIFACGFYPFGEEIRFSFFNPANFNYYSYSEFNYSYNSFYPNENGVYPKGSIDENEKLWLKYCHDKVSVEAIRSVLYDFKEEDIAEKSANEMLQYLYKTKNIEAINYLKFAKTCEFFNGIYEDPWERKEGATMPKRQNLLNKAIAISNKTKDKEIKLRYTFLAIRLAYYNYDFEQIKLLYDTVFKTQKKKDILNYWSLYFRTFAETDKALANFYAAQVFVKAPDKRFMISQSFDSKIPLEAVLKYAATNEERANVYFLAGIKKSDQALFCLEQVYKYDPKFEGLSFLLLREINKIEDWVFTPYYSLFNPAISKYNSWDNEDDNSIKGILGRVENDRKYADKVLQFVSKVNLKKINDPVLWRLGKSYLSFVIRNNQKCLNEIASLEKNITKKDSLYNQIQIIKALALTANQEKGKAVILEEVKPILLKNKNNRKFLFTIGRELEYKQNWTDAAFLYSKLDDSATKYGDYYDYNVVTWKNKKSKSSYRDFYSDYFDYIDANYSPEYVVDLVEEVKSKRENLDAFSKWKQSNILAQIPKLYDLIGTKYIRQNKLELAALYFGKLDSDELASYNDCLWEKPNCKGTDKYNENPFFVLKYTPNFIKQEKLFKLNKRSITEHLILYLKKASNPKEENKDYYYFLVANAYYNMTQYGNSWMMRRNSWSYIDDDPFEDEKEYYEGNLAQKYYLLSLKNAKTDQFKALCLRMIGRCEKNKLEYQFPNSYDNRIENYDNFLLSKNKYYQDLKSKYKDDYENLMSDCSSFEEYFKARR
ncbi:hypothetical protein HNP37_003121 [Flavobacterium nitrogenifigens]|uniref:Uncharacterized protein n=2 Tax=Flavobacterium TaxID=237 RepID=A0A7W7IYQ6_9FLAO|nr:MULTISPECIES: hypothetical protein [Flavobacterium]MBB4803046.1 hypothetical protein [Flavobacterium nitrogenifigens]MBB6388004.1 hypothetical protein [Flavobacterium notoginsengisoli]